MPTIPLYDTSAPPDGYHRVTAPGGYECWSIVARDAVRDIQLELDFCDGDQADPDYFLAYKQFMSRPTRVPPPRPQDYPAVYLRLSEKATPPYTFASPVRQNVFRFAEQPPTVTIGESALAWKSDASLRLTLAGLATKTNQRIIDGELTLDLLGSPVVESRQIQRAGRIAGILRERSGDNPCRMIEISGEVQYAHSYGTRPRF
jgi:hypothetical protein